MKKKAVLIMMTAALLCSACGTKQETTTTQIGSESTATEAEQTKEADAAGDVTATDEQAAAEPATDEIQTDETQKEPADATEADTQAQSTDDADSPGADRDLFADFIMGKGAAKLSSNYMDEIRMNDLGLVSGQEYTVNDIKELSARDNAMLEGVDPKVSYAPLTTGEGYLFAFKLYYETQSEILTELFVLSERSGELNIVFGVDGWSRRSIQINEYGVVFDDGSNGAGSHGSDIYVPDENQVYHNVSSVEENYIGWDFYDQNGQSIEALNKTMHEVADTYPDLETSVVFYKETIDKKDYFYYLGVEKITQDTVDKIDKIATANGFTFDGKATADEARTAYENSLGAGEAVTNKAEPSWKSLN